MHGVLYQLLWTLDRLAGTQVTFAGQDPKGILVTLEPEGGGGDVQIEDGRCRIVDQVKSRSSDRSWSLGEVIQGVLPDLYRATPRNGEPMGRTKYRFVAQGRLSDPDIFDSLKEACGAATGVEGINGLDDRLIV